MSVKVLIIDDDPLAKDILGRLIEAEGDHYDLISDPRRVQAVLDSGTPYDVIVCDLEMPSLDGYEVLPLLRARFGHRIPIVACTIHTSEMLTAMELGFDVFLAKPINVAAFPVVWRRILSGERFMQAD